MVLFGLSNDNGCLVSRPWLMRLMERVNWLGKPKPTKIAFEDEKLNLTKTADSDKRELSAILNLDS